MTGSVAQIVALTCHGNFALSQRAVPRFFPDNSTCQLCNSIKFVEPAKPLFGGTKEVVIADTPDAWIAGLPDRNATGIRLLHRKQNDARISDRMSAGFVGGGGVWMMEMLTSRGRSEFWTARWEVWNQQAPEQRIWRVTYYRCGENPTEPYPGRPLSVVKQDFRTGLESIRSFSRREDCGVFTQCFADALQALDDPGADVGYHKNLGVPGQLTPEAASLLKASMAASVFGGMGSWNDMGFDGAVQLEYEQVSENLFNILNEAIEVAATSSSQNSQ